MGASQEPGDIGRQQVLDGRGQTGGREGEAALVSELVLDRGAQLLTSPRAALAWNALLGHRTPVPA